MRFSTKYLIYDVLATLLCLFQATIAMATENVTNWYGLGDSECYRQTCTFGQFCSKSFLFRSCRSCDDVVIWCDTNLTHMAYQFPTCFYLCERKEKERLQAEVQGRPILDNIHISLIVMLVALAAFHVVVPLLRRFRQKRQQSKVQTGFSQNNGSNDDNNAALDTATDARRLLLTHVVDMDTSRPLDSAPLSDDDTATDPKTPSLPAAQPPEEEPQDHRPLQPSAPLHSDSSTSDLDTSADDDTADADDNGDNADDDGDNDNDSGVLVSAPGQGQVVRGSSSVEPELQPPVQIQDGINNFPIKTTDESEKGPLLATGVDNVDAVERLL